MTNIEKEEYWFCFIGPIQRNKVPFGGDFPLRETIKEAYYKMLGEYADVCSSGWGLSPEMKDRLNTIELLPQLNPSGKYLEAIDKLLYELNQELIRKEKENNCDTRGDY